MGDYRGTYCPKCQRETKHKKEKNRNMGAQIFSEVLQADPWKCLRCGNVQSCKRED